MRKLNKEHMAIILWIVLGISLLVYIPYGLAYTSLWFKPFHYAYTPTGTTTTMVNGTYYVNYDIGEIPHWNLMLMAWFEGLIKLLISVLVLGCTVAIGYLAYVAFDWLFPRVTSDKKENNE